MAGFFTAWAGDGPASGALSVRCGWPTRTATGAASAGSVPAAVGSVATAGASRVSGPETGCDTIMWCGVGWEVTCAAEAGCESVSTCGAEAGCGWPTTCGADAGRGCATTGGTDAGCGSATTCGAEAG